MTKGPQGRQEKGVGELQLLREEGRAPSKGKMDLLEGDKKVIRVAEKKKRQRHKRREN